MHKPTVFVSSSLEGLPIAHELARQLESSGAATVRADAAPSAGNTILESLTDAADRADFAIVVLSGDEAWSGRPGGALRVNVIFELGYLAGRLGSDRTFVVLGDTAGEPLPSKLIGVIYFPLSRRTGDDLATSVAPTAAAITKLVRSAGVREAPPPENSFSCFISYSWKDKDFAKNLHDDLLTVGVRSWLDAKEITVGADLSAEVQRGLQASDKVLLVLSESSVRSSWVKHEVRNAFELEKVRGHSVLFPIRIDDAIFSPSLSKDFGRVQAKLIADFSQWQDPVAYRRAFSRLVQDLAITTSAESAKGQ